MRQKAKSRLALPYFVIDFLIFAPLIFGFTFGLLVLRAKTAFGAIPYSAMQSTSALVDQAPNDALSSWFSYAAHLNLVYGLAPITIVSLLVIPYLVLQFRQQNLKPNERFHYFLMGLGLTLFLLAYQRGQLFFWMLA